MTKNRGGDPERIVISSHKQRVGLVQPDLAPHGILRRPVGAMSNLLAPARLASGGSLTTEHGGLNG